MNLSFGIRYADNTTIMSTVLEKLQLATEELQAACRKWGMKIKRYIIYRERGRERQRERGEGGKDRERGEGGKDRERGREGKT